MSLLDLQRGLRDHLLSGQGGVAGRMRGDPEAGLAVYHNAYRVQLIDCLGDTYEKTAAWLGDDAFETAARQHIETFPPVSWTLADYGGGFADTLASLYPDDPEVFDLAWLDWALRRAFDGADSSPLDTARLADLDWDAATFVFVPTLRLGVVNTNSAAIWSAMAEDCMPPSAERLAAPADIRVWRPDFSPRFKTISSTEARALRMAMAEISFGEICKHAIDAVDDAEAVRQASQILSDWLSDGLVSEIR
jgi:hypothetical protein